MQSAKLTTFELTFSSCLKKKKSRWKWKSIDFIHYFELSPPSMIAFSRVVSWIPLDEIELIDDERFGFVLTFVELLLEMKYRLDWPVGVTIGEKSSINVKLVWPKTWKTRQNAISTNCWWIFDIIFRTNRSLMIEWILNYLRVNFGITCSFMFVDNAPNSVSCLCIPQCNQIRRMERQ